jgi:hypothetical protein
MLKDIYLMASIFDIGDWEAIKVMYNEGHVNKLTFAKDKRLKRIMLLKLFHSTIPGMGDHALAHDHQDLD